MVHNRCLLMFCAVKRRLLKTIASREAIPAGDLLRTLPLRELEALSSSRLPVLLPVFHSRVARQKSSLLQHRPQIGAVLKKCTSNAVLDRSGLPTHAPAADVDQNV